MTKDIVFGRGELLMRISELAGIGGKIAGVKLAVQTIDLSEIRPEALLGILEDIEYEIEKTLKELNKKYYKEQDG